MAVLKEVTSSEGQMRLFIDEIHTVVGAWCRRGLDGRQATCSSRCWLPVSCVCNRWLRTLDEAPPAHREDPAWIRASSRCAW